MSSTRQSTQTEAENKAAHSRRNFLRLGTLGAAAVIAANVLPGSEAQAQQTRSTRKAAGMRTQGTGHQAVQGRQTRKLRTARSMGEYAEAGQQGQAKSGQRSRRSRSAARRSSPKTTMNTKTAKTTQGDGTRSGGKVNRMAGQRSAMRSMKRMKQTKAMKS
jgi:IMP dehydrogenase/GMP reductase